MGSKTDEDFGSHCMEYFMPEFRQLVKDGLNVVVGGDAFGCGSSREIAVNALTGKYIGKTCPVSITRVAYLIACLQVPVYNA